MLHAVCAVDAVNRQRHDGDGDDDNNDDIAASSSHSHPHQHVLNFSGSSLGLYPNYHQHQDPFATCSHARNTVATSVCKTHRASTWCCGDFVLRTLTKAHLD